MHVMNDKYSFGFDDLVFLPVIFGFAGGWRRIVFLSLFFQFLLFKISILARALPRINANKLNQN